MSIDPSDEVATRVYTEGVHELCKALKALHLKILASSWDKKEKVQKYDRLVRYVEQLESEARHHNTEPILLEYSPPPSPEISNHYSDEYKADNSNDDETEIPNHGDDGSEIMETSSDHDHKHTGEVQTHMSTFRRPYNMEKRNRTDAMYRGITIRTLVQNGLLNTGDILRSRYYGRTIETKIDANGCIGTEGTKGYSIHPTAWVTFEVLNANFIRL